MEETWSSAAIICPHCGHGHMDDIYDVKESGQEWECEAEACGRPFHVRAIVCVQYATRPLTLEELELGCE